MCKDIVFKFSYFTLDGYPVIGAGICDEKHKSDAESAFSSINTLSFGVKTFDPYDVDRLLQEKIAAVSPRYIKGLALSINVPDVEGPTGGIIGNPFMDGCSADNLIDDIGNGYSVAALPGGPGLMLKGSTSTAKNIFAQIAVGENKLISVDKIEKILKDCKIDVAVIIKDGTGSAENGMIMTYCFGETEYLSIRR